MTDTPPTPGPQPYGHPYDPDAVRAWLASPGETDSTVAGDLGVDHCFGLADDFEDRWFNQLERVLQEAQSAGVMPAGIIWTSHNYEGLPEGYLLTVDGVVRAASDWTLAEDLWDRPDEETDQLEADVVVAVLGELHRQLNELHADPAAVVRKAAA